MTPRHFLSKEGSISVNRKNTKETNRPAKASKEAGWIIDKRLLSHKGALLAERLLPCNHTIAGKQARKRYRHFRARK